MAKVGHEEAEVWGEDADGGLEPLLQLAGPAGPE